MRNLQGGPWNFDISDSTNNGFGGDAGDSSNSAEAHNYRGNFMVYSNTLPGYTEYSNQKNLLLLVDLQRDVLTNNITITVGDEYVHFDNHRGIQRSYSSPYLFTLNGQATTKGTPDFDIYFSMNRVVYPYSQTSRAGIGLCKAVIRAVDCVPIGPDDSDLTGPSPTVGEKGDPGVQAPTTA